jgi:uncharacterized membrane protein
MKLWVKWTIIIVATLLVAALAGGFIYVRNTQKLIPDLDAQWAAAELVVAYYQDKRQLPENWEALQAYFPDGAPHRRDLSFDEIRNRISIDFLALPVLTKTFSNPEAIPEIITTRSRVDAHWKDAEPNQLVNAAVAQP